MQEKSKHSHQFKSFLNYLGSVAIAGTALALHKWTALDEGARFIFLYLAFIASPYLFGFWPGIVTTVLCLAGIPMSLVPGDFSLRALVQDSIIVIVTICTNWIQKRWRDSESNLKMSQQRLSEAHKIAQLASWEIDLQTGNCWWSDQIYAMYGLDPSQVKPSQEHFLRMIHPKDLKEFLKGFQFALNSGGDQRIFRIVRPNGEIRYIHGYASVSYDSAEKPILIRGTNQDITDNQLSQLALKEREAQLSAIYSSVAGILFYVKVEAPNTFRFISINNAFLKTTGLQESQVLGKCIQEVIPPESIEQVLQKYSESVRTASVVRWEEKSRYPTGQ